MPRIKASKFLLSYKSRKLLSKTKKMGHEISMKRKALREKIPVNAFVTPRTGL